MKALELYRNKNNGYPCTGTVVTNAATLPCTDGINNGSQASTLFLKRPSASYSARDTILRTGLGFQPNEDSVRWSLAYNVRNSAATNKADRSSYTIIVGQENAPTFTALPSYPNLRFCKITSGTPDTVTVTVTDAVLVSTIIDCPFGDVQ